MPQRADVPLSPCSGSTAWATPWPLPSRQNPKGRHPQDTLQNRQPGTESSAPAPSACELCSVLECPPSAPASAPAASSIPPNIPFFPSTLPGSPALLHPHFPSAFWDPSFLRGLWIRSTSFPLALRLRVTVLSHFAPPLALSCKAFGTVWM